MTAPRQIRLPKIMNPREKKPWLPKIPIRFGTTPPPIRKAMGMVKEMAIFCIFFDPIRDSAANAGGKKQTASSGWQKMTILIHCPDRTPTSRVNTPVKKRTADSVGFRPARSDTHPINSGMGRVRILDMVIKELAWDRGIP